MPKSDEEIRKSIGKYEENLSEYKRSSNPKESVDKLIELSAQPVASAPGKPQPSGSYSGKRTRSRKVGDTSARRSGKSRQ